MNALARREHGESELCEKLTRKGCDSTLVTQEVGRLVEEGLVSDRRFTESWIQAKRGRGYGPVKIRLELEQKGVSDHTIEACLEDLQREWLADIERVKAKKFGSEIPADYQERARQASFLQYRGYTFDQIRQVLDGKVFE